MHGLVVIEGMTLSGHPWIINEILFKERNTITLKKYFSISGALQKKIKVALQVQKVPMKLLKLTCPEASLKFSPLVAIEPRRRRFHNAVQVLLIL